MTLALKMKRGWVFGLALLLFLAVVGPSCFASAVSAFAMPSHSVPAQGSGCDAPSGGMTDCPHADSGKTFADSAKSENTQIDLVDGNIAGEPDDHVGRARILVSSDVHEPPPTHSTPLRL